MKTKRQLKRRLRLLYVCSFLFTLAPVLTVVIINWKSYVETPAQAFKLTVGGVLAAAILLFAVLGKLKIPSGVVCCAVVFMLAFLLESVLDDLKILSGALLLGMVIDYIFFKRAIRATNEQLLVDRAADATAERVEAILNNYIGGRV